LVAALSLVMALASPVAANPSGTDSSTSLPRASTNTDMTLTGTGPGQSVSGYIANSDNPFDPVLDGYPTTTPPPDFTARDESFAGIIYGTPAGGGSPLSLYCFDILTDTYIGVGYTLGTWDAANVPNVGFVARILNDYYPFVPTEPAALYPNTTKMAAAVQAAIWFFSDRYVLSTSDPLYSTVATIVADTIAAGPVLAPTPPDLSITPTFASSPNTATPVGPFTITSSAPVTVTATGANMYSDATLTTPIANGSTVSSGQQIWLESTGATSAVLQAIATATVPFQNVYIYDGNTAGLSAAQKLILALPDTLSTTVYANAEFLPSGSLRIQKTIAGRAAGKQGQVTIKAVCDGAPLTPPLVVASGTPASTSSRTYTGIPAGSECTVSETANGVVTGIVVTTVGDGTQVTIPAGGTETVDITNTYDFTPGSVVITKAITGDGAHLRGDIVISLSCVGVPASDTPDYVIPASTAPEDVVPMEYNDIPAGASCTVSEPEKGSNAEVTAAVSASVNGTAVTLPATFTVGSATTTGSGATVEVDVTNDYSLNPGSLVVTKTIAGPGAGKQGAITITVSCLEGDATISFPDFDILPGATGTDSKTYSRIPAGAECTVEETVNGSTTTVAAEVTITDGETTIPPGGTVTTTITDTYTTSGLVVTKTITGDGAGHQGAVTISVSCVGVPATDTPDFVIPAGARAGETSMLYTGIPLGTACTVTETGDGASPPSLTVVTTGSPSTVTVDPVAEVDITDDYTYVTGSLSVTKTIAGPAAGKQGAVTIEAYCDGALLTPVFTIPPGATGSPSHTYTGVPAGAVCIVIETVDGSSRTVTVTVSEPVPTATIPDNGGTVTVPITDTYTTVPGSILVGKLLAGPFAGSQGAITIAATCGITVLPSFVIPAGTPAGLQLHSYDNIPAGSVCTITETVDGETATVTATVLPDNRQTVTVPAATVVPVFFTDLLTDAPGTLTVTKVIAGPAAGRQGEIGILVNCGEPSDQFGFDIPANFAAGSVSRSFGGVPAGATCAITETNNGATSGVSVATVGGSQTVTIAAAQTASAVLTDTYTRLAAVTPTTTAPTLPTTGAAPRHVIDLGLIAAAAGLALVAVEVGRRRRWRGLHLKR
jgi:Domain of unknown function (DUF5979)/Thioester domain